MNLFFDRMDEKKELTREETIWLEDNAFADVRSEGQ